MYFKTVLAAAVTFLFVGQAMGAVLIAPNPVAACNCPNNCEHHLGDSCAFYKDGNTLEGECQHRNGKLKCIA